MLKNRGKAEGKTARTREATHTGRLLLVLGVVAIFALVVATGLFFGYKFLEKQSALSVDIGQGEQVASRVELLPDSEIEELAAAKVSPLFNLDGTYAKALALARQEKYRESLDVYAAIDMTGKARYYMYVDYGLTASRAGDPVTAAKQLQRAIAELEADGSVSSDVKTDLRKRLASKLSGFQQEAGR